MGADLYWKKTPKLREEKYVGLNLSTWYFLAKLWGYDNIDDINGGELTEDCLIELKAILFTAEQSNNTDLADDINGLIGGIIKYQSITLNIKS
jgi:hypothetical protein